MTQGIGKHLDSIMRVMKFASNRGRSHFNEKSFLSNESKKKFLQYQTMTKTKYQLSTRDENPFLDLNAMIFRCFMKIFEDDYQVEPKCDGLFQPVVTDMGICPSFNPTPTMDLLKPSHFTDSFFKAYQDDMIHNYSVSYGEELGQSLNMLLVRNTQEPEEAKAGQRKIIPEPSKFYMSITRHNEYINFKPSSFIVKGGYKTTIHVEPMEIIASEDLRSVPISKRQCRFEDETEGIMLLKRYSQSGCQFEMKIRKLQDICKCTPWYIPSTFGPNLTICDSYGSYCFNTLMKRLESSKECLPNCNLVQFTQNQIWEKIDPNKVCYQSKNMWRGTTENIRKFRDLELYLMVKKVNSMLKDLKANHQNETYDGQKAGEEFCKYMVDNHMAEVKIQFGSKKYIRTKMSVKVSFTDRLGVFGKKLILNLTINDIIKFII